MQFRPPFIPPKDKDVNQLQNTSVDYSVAENKGFVDFGGLWNNLVLEAGVRIELTHVGFAIPRITTLRTGLKAVFVASYQLYKIESKQAEF